MTNSRVTQSHVEVAVLPTDAKARVAQSHVEVAVLPTDAKARIAQSWIEVAYLPIQLEGSMSLSGTANGSIRIAGGGSGTLALSGTANGTASSTLQGGGYGFMTLTGALVGIPRILGGGVGSMSLTGQITQPATHTVSEHLLGDGMPFSEPKDVEILMAIDPLGQLLNVSDDMVDRTSISITRHMAGGVSSASYSLNAAIGSLPEIKGLQPVYIKDAGRTYGNGRFYRIFGGWTSDVDSTQVAKDNDIPVQCVGFDRLLDFPPLAVSTAWPPSFDNAGTPVVNTTSSTAITDLNVPYIFRVASANNIFVGETYTAVNADGSNLEEIEISAVSYLGDGLIIEATFTSEKTENWLLVGGISDLQFYADGWHGILAKTRVRNGLNATDLNRLITITPLSMVGIVPGVQLYCFNKTNLHFEIVTPTNITATTFDAVFTSTKTANWRINIVYQYRGFIDTFYNDTKQATVSAAVGTGVHIVTPDSMENVTRGRTMWCADADGGAGEEIIVDSVGLGYFIPRAPGFTKAKSAGWKIYNGPYVSKGGVSRVIKSLPHVRIDPGTSPRQVNAKIRAYSIDQTIAPRDFIGFVEDSPDHLTPFSPQWVHYDALATTGILAPISLTNYIVVDPDHEAYFASYNLSKQGGQRFNAIAVTGRNGCKDRYVDALDVQDQLGRVWEAPTIHDNDLLTNEACLERATQIVLNYLSDKKTFRVITYSEVDPRVWNNPMKVRLYNNAEYSSPNYRDFPVASVTLDYSEYIAKYTFELSETPVDLDGQLMPFGLGKRPHATGGPATVSSEYAVTDLTDIIRYPNPDMLLMDRHGHFLGFAPNTPLLNKSASFDVVDTTLTYVVSTDSLAPSPVYAYLPPAADHPYRKATVMHLTGGGSVIPTASSGDTTNAPELPTAGQSVTVQSDGVDKWLVTSSHGLGTALVAGGQFIVGNGIDAISSGDQGTIGIPFNCILSQFSMWGDVLGSITVDLLRVTYDDYQGWDDLNTAWISIPTVDGGNLPEIFSDVKMRDSALTNWNTYADVGGNRLALLAGDILKFNVVSNTAMRAVTCVLWVART